MTEVGDDEPSSAESEDRRRVERLLADARKRLGEMRQRIGHLFHQDSVARTNASRFIRLGFILFGALVAGVAQFIPGLIQQENAPPLWIPVIGVAGSLMVFLGGLWLGFGEKLGPEMLDAARVAVEAADNERAMLRSEIERFNTEVERWREDERELSADLIFFIDLLVLWGLLRGAVESRMREQRPMHDSDVQALLKISGDRIHELIGFEVGERWTLTVFRVAKAGEPDAGRLVCVATTRWDRDQEQREHRTWGVGEGVGGYALMTGRETVVEDMTDRERAGWVYFPEGGEWESELYKSLAAVPIRVAKDTPIWGMVIATSDEGSRFRVDAEGVSSGEVEPLRALAGMIALLVARDTPPPSS